MENYPLSNIVSLSTGCHINNWSGRVYWVLCFLSHERLYREEQVVKSLTEPPHIIQRENNSALILDWNNWERKHSLIQKMGFVLRFQINTSCHKKPQDASRIPNFSKFRVPIGLVRLYRVYLFSKWSYSISMKPQFCFSRQSTTSSTLLVPSLRPLDLYVLMDYSHVNQSSPVNHTYKSSHLPFLFIL